MPKDNTSNQNRKTASTAESSVPSPDMTPVIKNFLIGLFACCAIVISVIVCAMNFDNLKMGFVGASKKVSSLVPEQKKIPTPTKRSVAPPPPPPKDELYGDEPTAEVKSGDDQRAPMRRSRRRIE